MTNHLLDEIEQIISDTHDMDVTDRDYAKAIVEKLPDMINPLEWEGRKSDHYRVHIGYGLMNGVFALTYCGSTVGEFGSEEAAKAAAEAHHCAAIMSAFGVTNEH